MRLGISLVLIAWTASVHAQDAPATEAPEEPPDETSTEGGTEEPESPSPNDEQAHIHFQSGRLHFERGDYEQALPEFQAAYELSPRPELLFNLYITQQNLGNLPEARDYLRDYLASDVVPEEERSTLSARLENLDRRTREAEAEEAARERELAEAQARAAEPTYSHSGFAFRALLGIAFKSAALNFPCPPVVPDRRCSPGDDVELRATGLGTNLKLMVGWAFLENLILQLEVFGGTMVAGTVELTGNEIDSDSVEYSATTIALGATYYFMPLNLYISGSFGIAFANIEGQVGDPEASPGFGMALLIGKEWWIGEDWGFGVAVGYDLFLTGESIADEDSLLIGQSVGLYASLTYN
ncbi:MAG: tetratricopeptide repeat protein [Myxococcota bacterium]